MQTECPTHENYTLNQICIQRDCQNRGAVCQLCLLEHPGHKIQQLKDFLFDQQRVLSLLDDNLKNELIEDEFQQQEILKQLDNLKRNVTNSIFLLQNDLQQAFRDEINVRHAFINDKERRKNILNQVLNDRSLEGHQIKQKILELLHRQQMQASNSPTTRYNLLQDKIESASKEILKIISQINQLKFSNPESSQILEQYSIPEHQVKMTISNERPVQKPKMELSKSPSEKQQQAIAKKQFSDSAINNELPNQFGQKVQQQVEYNYSSQKPQLKSLVEVSKPIQNQGTNLDSSSRQILLTESSHPLDKQEKQEKTKIFENQMLSRANSKISQKSVSPVPSSRYQLQQRDLSPVGTYNQKREIKQENYYGTQQQNQPQSYASIQVPEKQEKPTITSSIPPPFIDPFYNVKQNNESSQIQLSQYISAQEGAIKKQQLLISKSQSQFHSEIQSQQQDLNASYLSNKTVAPPPVKKADIQSKFKQNRINAWRAHEKGVKDLALMDQDKLISCSSDNNIKIWDRNTCSEKITLSGHEKPVLCIAFHQNKRVLISGSADRTVRVWRPQPKWSSVMILKGHLDRVRCVCFITHQLIASGSDDTTIKIWDLEMDGLCTMTISQNNGRISAVVSQNSVLLAGCDGFIALWDTITFQQVKEQQAHTNLIISLHLAMSGDTGLIVSGGKDNMIKVWDYPGLKLYISVKEDYTPICFDLCDNLLLVGCMGYQSEGKICIWEIKEDLKKVQEICDNGTGVNRALFDKNGMIFACFENKKIEVWQLTEY